MKLGPRAAESDVSWASGRSCIYSHHSPGGLIKTYGNRHLTLPNPQDSPAWINLTISGKTRTNPPPAIKLLLVSRERQEWPVWWPKKPCDYLLQLLQLTAGVHNALAQHLHSSSSQSVIPYMQLCQGRLGTEDRAQGLTAGTCQIAVLQPAGERQQRWGKCTPRITEVLLRDVYLPGLGRGKDTTALIVHDPLGSGLSKLVPSFYMCAVIFYQLYLCHKQIACMLPSAKSLIQHLHQNKDSTHRQSHNWFIEVI